ncbi:MAG: ATPase [Pseudopedobacter saltans]|uniref:ATPase n=1 Tax=Pseudopedobacter saltans TaxID=151895 RepID=A0A2W5ENF6_9SPHI|nr:MAG: ATPase [Pseudopedobacter saltans]
MKKIVVIGPESTGKSSLCEQLAKHFNTYWCEEYARQYLLDNGKNYSFDELLTIAKGQLQLEEETTRKAQAENKEFVFIDTDMYVMKVWSEYVFEKCDNFILDEIVRRQYDYYFLANIDLPWTPDELREYPDEKPRIELFHMYKDILENQSTPWSLISGTGEERFEMAFKIVESIS